MLHSSIHWFRKSLRLHNNQVLLGTAMDCHRFCPLFILDPSGLPAGTSARRFLLKSLWDLDWSLRNVGSRLFVARGSPEAVFPGLFHAWGTTHLTFEAATDPHSCQRKAAVAKLAARHSVEVTWGAPHTLYNTHRVLTLNSGKAPLSYKRLQNLLAALGPLEKPVLVLTCDYLQGCYTPHHNANFGVPTLEELGQDPAEEGPHLYLVRETAALIRLDALMERTAWMCGFEKPETAPNSLSPSTTILSPYITFSCLSIHAFWQRLDRVYQGVRQLLWREFFYITGANIPDFERMVSNPVCLQVDWDNNPKHLHAWREDCTGFPFIDATMTQLRNEGWIHHLTRHAIACFLTRRDLWISWEEGLKVFEELLLDADWSLNAGNWLWLSGSAFFHRYFHIYWPVAFGKKTDRDGAYTWKYLPTLKDFPAKYIYEPWKAPRAVQERAGCLIGTHYSRPTLERGAASKRNMERMKAVCAQKGAQQEPPSSPKSQRKKPKIKQRRAPQGPAPLVMF